MSDVYEEKVCTCTNELDPTCEACVEVKVDGDRWEHLHAHLDQAASDIHEAVTKGVAAAGPVFRDKVAPALSDATAKLAELADSARKTTSEKAGIADDTDKAPLHQIGGGLAAIATGLLGLSKSLAEWLSEHTANVAPSDKDKVKDDDDVELVAEILQQPVVVADGDIEVVEP